MLDIKFIVNNVSAVNENIKNRHMNIDINQLLELYHQKNREILNLDCLREKANNITKNFKKIKEGNKTVINEEAIQLKKEIAEKTLILKRITEQFNLALAKVPNMTASDVPLGKIDKDNQVVKIHGEIPKLDFLIKDHTQLGKSLDILDFDSAAMTTGSKFYFLKNEGVILELALIRFALDKALTKGYQLLATPDLARDDIISFSGYSPRGPETQIYSIENTNLSLVGTSEILIGGYYSNQIIAEEKLPIKVAAISHCFRTEAGSYGSESRGLYRVHQFSKVELYQITSGEESNSALEEIVQLEEEIYKDLGIPYRLVKVCTGDLGATAFKKYDIEGWMAAKGSGDEAYGEITSASNCTDYQSRRLKIFYENASRKKFLAHTLNGTAIAVSRTLIALLENNQLSDGSIRIPEVLWPYTGFKIITKK